jgi:malonyl-CoA O-methyltransferase
MRIKDAYTNWAVTYDQDRNRTRDLDRTVTRQLLGHLRFRSILEIGCGTGKNTGLYSEIADEVRAFDFSEAMLEQARTKIVARNVSFAVTDITREWPVTNGSVELVACNLVLEHIEDLDFIFSEANRVLANNGCFFVSELHPFRQYQGTKANFQRNELTTEIDAFVHHTSDFTQTAFAHGLFLKDFKEWWHEEDAGKPPRLVSFMFERQRKLAAD